MVAGPAAECVNSVKSITKPNKELSELEILAAENQQLRVQVAELLQKKEEAAQSLIRH